MVQADDAKISDETLLGRTAAGDSSAFDRLVRRYQAAVCRFVQASIPADSEAEEIVRDTFLAARRGASRFRDEPSARPWLLLLARQTVARRHPRASRDADATPLRELAQAAGWGDPTAVSVDHAAVGSALEALAPEDREVLALCDREGFTVDEAAQIAGLSASAVRTRLHRARLRLLAELRGTARGR